MIFFEGKMPTPSDYAVRLNDRGEPDVSYYLTSARQMRSQAMAEALGGFAAKTAAVLKLGFSRIVALFKDELHRLSTTHHGRAA
mgnify:CR=1 FL=1